MEGQPPPPQQQTSPEQMQQQPPQANMMMYQQGAPQQDPNNGTGGDGQPPQQQPPQDGQQQQAAYAQGYPPQMFAAQMPFFQGQQGYGAPQDYNDPRFAASMMAAQYPQAGDMNQQQSPQDYMNANNYLMARLSQQQGQNPWMSMPMGGYPGMEQGGGYDPMAASLGPWSATSAGLLGKIGGTEQKKKTIRKKHKDKPKRPLSAYNLFFKDERKKILESIPTKTEDDEDEDELDEEGNKKKKKPPHGKIGFENLAKIIGQRWQKLEPDRIEHYKKLAGKDMKRYKEQMEVFLVKVENEKKKKFEEETAAAVAEDDAEKGGDEETGEPAAKKAKTEEAEEEEGEEAKGEE